MGSERNRPGGSGRSRGRNNSQEPRGESFKNKVALLNAMMKMPKCPLDLAIKGN